MRFSDIFAALAFLTRLPLAMSAPRGNIAAQSWAWPVAGAVVGAVAGGAVWLAALASVPFGVAAFVGLVLLVLMTGGLHEDGLADTADGLWCPGGEKERLAIMKDSRIGVFGATAVCLSLLGRWLGLEAAGSSQILPALIAACAVSRTAMVMVMFRMTPAKREGLAYSAGSPGLQTVVTSIVLAALIAVATVGWLAVPLLVVAGVATIPVCWLAQRKVGGITGDIVGAAQQCSELAAVLFLASVL